MGVRPPRKPAPRRAARRGASASRRRTRRAAVPLQRRRVSRARVQAFLGRESPGMALASRASGKQFGWIHEIACPTENDIYVAELLNWRLQKLTLKPRPPKLPPPASSGWVEWVAVGQLSGSVEWSGGRGVRPVEWVRPGGYYPAYATYRSTDYSLSFEEPSDLCIEETWRPPRAAASARAMPPEGRDRRNVDVLNERSFVLRISGPESTQIGR
jgi:hypothetical protein